MGAIGGTTVLTRCPACETHFRVTAEQLKARSGRVRCGECHHVFNALDSLIEEPMVVVAPLVAESPQTNLAGFTSETGAEAPYLDAGMDVAAVPPAPTIEPEDQALEERSTFKPGPQDPPDPQSPAEATPEAAEAITVAETAVPDWSETFPEPPSPPRRWPWVIGSVLALTAMSLQAVLAFRVELAVLWPDAKPALSALCEIAGYEVGLPAKVALVGIEASDLYPDTQHNGRLTLAATLKNRAPFNQQFPHLELTLTDTTDKAIARKVLAPADYLPLKTSSAYGMQPNADTMVIVGVDPGEMTASGYRLYLFYP
jgi:predicted Zn finger-like uncharacterized protein